MDMRSHTVVPVSVPSYPEGRQVGRTYPTFASEQYPERAYSTSRGIAANAGDIKFVPSVANVAARIPTTVTVSGKAGNAGASEDCSDTGVPVRVPLYPDGRQVGRPYQTFTSEQHPERVYMTSPGISPVSAADRRLVPDDAIVAAREPNTVISTGTARDMGASIDMRSRIGFPVSMPSYPEGRQVGTAYQTLTSEQYPERIISTSRGIISDSAAGRGFGTDVGTVAARVPTSVTSTGTTRDAGASIDMRSVIGGPANVHSVVGAYGMRVPQGRIVGAMQPDVGVSGIGGPTIEFARVTAPSRALSAEAIQSGAVADMGLSNLAAIAPESIITGSAPEGTVSKGGAQAGSFGRSGYSNGMAIPHRTNVIHVAPARVFISEMLNHPSKVGGSGIATHGMNRGVIPFRGFSGHIRGVDDGLTGIKIPGTVAVSSPAGVPPGGLNITDSKMVAAPLMGYTSSETTGKKCNWSEWGDWSSCTEAGAFFKRSRKCVGDYGCVCYGASGETRACTAA